MTIAESSASILKKLGRPVVFRHTTAEVRDPITGAVTSPGSTTEISGFGRPGRFISQRVDGEAVRRTDTRLVVAGLSEPPQVGWDCEVRDTVYKVLDAEIVEFGMVDAVYICQLRV